MFGAFLNNFFISRLFKNMLCIYDHMAIGFSGCVFSGCFFPEVSFAGYPDRRKGQGLSKNLHLFWSFTFEAWRYNLTCT